MDDLTKALAKNYRDLRMEEIHLQHVMEDREARKSYLAPDTGWEGKNEEARRLAAEKAFAADEVCEKLRAMARNNEIEIARLTGDVQALEAERRAYEWGVREQMIKALRGVLPVENPEGVDNRAFDDVLGQAFEEATIEELGKLDPIEAHDAAIYDAMVAEGLTDQPEESFFELVISPAVDDELPF